MVIMEKVHLESVPLARGPPSRGQEAGSSLHQWAGSGTRRAEGTSLHRRASAPAGGAGAAAAADRTSAEAQATNKRQ